MNSVQPYLSPEVDVWILPYGQDLLESLSLEGNVDDITEGGDLNSATDW